MSTQLAGRAVPAELAAAQALFREARRRRQRRRLAGAVAVVLTATSGVLFAVTGTHAPSLRENGGTRSPGAAAAARSAVTAVWYDGTDVRIGSVHPDGTVTQRVVAEANADLLPLVQAGGRVYWVDPAGSYVPSLGHWSEVVRYLDVATGTIGAAGAGETVFLSADRRSLFMAQTANSLTEVPVAAGGPARQLSLPRGWYLPGGDGLADVISGDGLATANGVVVQSQEGWSPGGSVLAVWNPADGRLVVIGRAVAVIDAYTPPGAGHSLLAWVPAGCRLPGNCPVTITNTATLAARTVRSPLPGGFAMGGAFSPNGTQLAVFMNDRTGQVARLALVDPATGAVRVAPEPRLALGIDIAWARWLPDGAHLLVGAETSYLVAAATLAARPVKALNYTAAVLP